MQYETADFALVPPPSELDKIYPSSLILAYSVQCVCRWRHENMTSSTKPEIHIILHCHRTVTKPRPLYRIFG